MHAADICTRAAAYRSRCFCVGKRARYACTACAEEVDGGGGGLALTESAQYSARGRSGSSLAEREGGYDGEEICERRGNILGWNIVGARGCGVWRKLVSEREEYDRW